MQIEKSIFKGTKITIGNETYVDAQYISKTLNDQDKFVNYSRFILLESKRFFSFTPRKRKKK